MPLIQDNFNPTFWSRNPHLATIVPNKFRKISGVQYQRKRIELQDGDFIDLDFSCVHSSRLVLILHGLEGNSDRAYAKAITRSVNSKNWDACVMNQRSCSGELNRLLSSYHSGKSDDLHEILGWIEHNTNYSHIHLIGFSLGGNIVLKYLGENPKLITNKIQSAVTISVPTDLSSSALKLARKGNWVYMRRFIKSLKSKTQRKIELFPECGISIEELMSCKNFIDYDNLYTAPVHGFKDAEEYWSKCSSKQFISNIQIPTLLLTSADDPFLGKECYPIEEADLPNFHLLMTKKGGHVGFVDQSMQQTIYSERVAMNFLNSTIST